MISELIEDTKAVEYTFREAEQITRQFSTFEAYKFTIDLLESALNIKAVPSISGLGCHKYYKLSKPSHNGISDSCEMFIQLMPDELEQLKADLIKLRLQLYENPADAMDSYAAKMLVNLPERWEGDFAEQGRIACIEASKFKREIIARHGLPNMKAVSKTQLLPFSALPMPEDFAPAIIDANLELKDLLLTFPPAELECIELAIGRGLAGPDNSMPIGFGRRINKGWKASITCLGEPNTGKSTFFNKLNMALTTQGYITTSFSALDARFGMGKIITSDFAFCDDTNAQQITSFIKSNLYKTIVTSGIVPCEDKNKDMVDEASTTVLFMNANNIDAYELQNADIGAHERMFLLGNYSSAQLGLMYGDRNNWVFPALLAKQCARLGCDEISLLLWIARKCLDKYMAYPDDGYSVQARMLELKPMLKERAFNESTTSYAQAMSLACYVYGHKLIASDSKSLTKGILATIALIADSNSHANKSAIKADYEAKGKPVHHPWRCIGQMDAGSARHIVNSMQEFEVLQPKVLITRLLELSYTEQFDSFGKSAKRFIAGLQAKLDEALLGRLEKLQVPSTIDFPENETFQERADRLL